MNRASGAPLMRRLASAVMRVAAALMPRDEQDWARAMRAEFDHAAAGEHPLGWALGCVLAAFKQRMESMKMGNLLVSRWVLLAETLLCFVPPTLALIGGLYFMLQVAQLDAVHAHRFWHGGAPGGAAVLGSMFLATVLSVAGPLGLALGGYYLLHRRRGGPHWLYGLVLWCSVGLGLAQVVGRLANSGLAAFAPGSTDVFDFYSALILLSVLPALAAIHLRRLSVSPLPAGTR